MKQAAATEGEEEGSGSNDGKFAGHSDKLKMVSDLKYEVEDEKPQSPSVVHHPSNPSRWQAAAVHLTTPIIPHCRLLSRSPIGCCADESINGFDFTVNTAHFLFAEIKR
jgi:hypothetical protein